MARTVKINDLASTIINELKNYDDVIAEDIKNDVSSVAKETVQELKSKSPKNTGDYAKGWRQKTTFENDHDIRITVYNSKKPQLTHLLENGHPIVDKEKRQIGYASPKPHIGPAERNAEQKLDKKVKVTVRGNNN